MEFIACDLETTGMQSDQDQIIEVAMVRVVDGKATETFNSLVNPGRRIPLKIKRLTGIDDDRLAAAPTLPQILPEIHSFMRPVPLVGHNIEFDRSFLAANLGTLPFTGCLDTLELARIVLSATPGHSLANLVRHLELPMREQHRALDDALSTIDLFNFLLYKLGSIKLEVLAQLLALLKQGGSPWAEILAGQVGNRVSDFSTGKITSNLLFKDPAGAQKTVRGPARKPDPGGDHSIENLLGPGSPLTGLLPNYEHRREQVKMAGAVEQILAEQKILLLEAGTGTGKSLAYMLPALLWSLWQDRRAVVATGTINLQEQLWQKDIPLLRSLLGLPFQAALLKGRTNYLCLRRFFHLLDDISALAPGEAVLAARILVWLQETDSGDRSELNLYGADNENWTQLCSDSETCFGPGCRWYNRFCFVTRARRSAENSQLLIINHALLFTDMTADSKILPPHEVLVIDEAHHIEDTATRYLGKKISRSGITRWLSLAGKHLKKLQGTAPPQDGKRWFGALGETEKIRHELKDSADTFFTSLAGACGSLARQGYHQSKFRLHREPGLLEPVQAQYQNFLYRLRGFIAALKPVTGMLEDWTAAGEPWEEKLQDIYLIAGLGTDFLSDLLFILEKPAENYVCWAEVYKPATGSGYVNCTLHATPVDISTVLHEQLFNTSRAIVLTSATLTVGGKFDHFMDRCGLSLLPAESVETGIMESPFDYENQCLLCIADDMPVHNQGDAANYLGALVDTIYTLATEAGGKTMVLFTSHKQLRDVYYQTRPLFEDAGICLLGHSLDGGRSRLVEEFTRDGRSVLFGTTSFWEGVDIPGDALVNVIIVKLPFAPPDDPVQEARQEIISARGRSPFYGLSLPQAVIRFKQGFGRLIRSKRDRGAVVILDRRIIEKRYGKVFLNSLPVKTHLRGDIYHIRKKLAAWIR